MENFTVKENILFLMETFMKENSTTENGKVKENILFLTETFMKENSRTENHLYHTETI